MLCSADQSASHGLDIERNNSSPLKLTACLWTESLNFNCKHASNDILV
uniref:Uncharacterized protein n=1 Tax=Arundo donax TaxID=35708 RepID=A0A0A9GNB1_ARUDO